MIRAASIGLGWWSDQLAAAIQGRSDHIEVVSCYSRSIEKCFAFAEKFGTKVHSSYQDLLSDNDIDAVIISTPHSLHAEHVVQAAAAKKNIFVEKPFTLTAQSGLYAKIACQSAGVVLAVGHNRRFSNAANQIKKMRDAGEFGTLLHLEANFSAPGALSFTPDRWRANRVESPAGGISALGVHLIDLLCFLEGPIVQVNAQAIRRVVSVDMDDTTSSLFQFASGATGYLGCMFACPHTSFLNVYGTKANAFAKIDAEKLYIQSPNEQPLDMEIEPADTLKEELEEFAQACQGVRPFRVTPAQALSNVAVMEAITASAVSGEAVEMEEQFYSAWSRNK